MIESSEAIIFNGINLVDRFTDEDTGAYFIVNSVYGREVSAVDNQLIRLPKRPGAIVSSYKTPERILDVEISMKGTSGDDLRKRIDELNGILHTGVKEVPIEFVDESDRTYFGKLDAVETDLEKSNVFKATLSFLCSDPYKYGPEKTLELEDISTVENKGTAEAEPIFELTAKKKTTFAMVSTGTDEDAEYNLIGTPTDVDEEVVDSKNQIFVEYGETLEEWKEPGSEFDNGKVTGDQLGFDGTGIHPLSYGDPGDWDKWYGPALMREITPIQDFEVEMRLRVNTSKPNELYRIEFYLYDENMNEIGKMAIRDFSLTVQRYAAEGRIGEFKGAGENYLISQENYLREASHFHGLVRMRRVGNEFEFYAARLKTGDDEYGKHHDIIRVPFRDKDNEYQGKLKYVQINIARHAQGLRASVPRINSIRVNELMEETVDKTPYILYPEDVVTFDHKNDDLLINGEPRNDLKNFGGSFFNLEKGYNNLIVTPSETFDSEVKFRDKYL